MLDSDNKRLKTKWFYGQQRLSHVQTVLIVHVALCAAVKRITLHAVLWCVLNGLQLQKLSSPLQPTISRWVVDCTACTCRTTSLALRGLPPSIQCFRKCDGASQHDVLRPFHDVLRPYVTCMLLPSSCERCRAASKPSQQAVCRRNRGVPWHTEVSNFLPSRRKAYGTTYVLSLSLSLSLSTA